MLKDFVLQFDKVLHEFLDTKIHQTQKILGDYNFYVAYAKQLCSSGKRIRPYNFYMMAKAYSDTAHDQYDKELMEIALAFELLHTFALIHDDIIDQAQQRRSVTTAHIHFAQKLNNQHIGMGQAILLGDLLFGWANELLCLPRASFSSEQLLGVRKEFAQMVQEVVLGQFLDVHMMTGVTVTQDLLQNKSYYKTASYTFVKPLLAGARAAGIVQEKELAKITTIGDLLGVAFQVRDDLKDMIDCHDDKDVFNDVQEGQQTVMTQYIFEHADKQQQEFLQKKMGTQLSDQDKKDLTVLFESTGAFDYAKKAISQALDKANILLDDLQMDKKHKPAFTHIISLLRMD